MFPCFDFNKVLFIQQKKKKKTGIPNTWASFHSGDENNYNPRASEKKKKMSIQDYIVLMEEKKML